MEHKLPLVRITSNKQEPLRKIGLIVEFRLIFSTYAFSFPLFCYLNFLVDLTQMV